MVGWMAVRELSMVGISTAMGCNGVEEGRTVEQALGVGQKMVFDSLSFHLQRKRRWEFWHLQVISKRSWTPIHFPSSLLPSSLSGCRSQTSMEGFLYSEHYCGCSFPWPVLGTGGVENGNSS